MTDSRPHGRRARMTRTAWLFVGLLAVPVVAWVLPGVSEHCSPDRLLPKLRALSAYPYGRWWVALGVIALLIVDLVLPVPSSVVVVFAGVALGTWWGWIASWIGSCLESFLGYTICRLGGRRAYERLVGVEEAMQCHELFERRGWWAIALTRPLPIVNEAMVFLAGLAAMPIRPFVAAVVAGTAPANLLWAWLGANLVEPGRFEWVVVGGAVLMVAAWGATRYIFFGRMQDRSRSAFPR